MRVGDYVRTDDGMIAKIERFWVYHNINFITTDKDTISESMVVKSSPNIIDLIEVGDIITTNNLCGEITKIEGNKIYTTCYDGEYCSASDIKSIATKEQFENCMYKIGE